MTDRISKREEGAHEAPSTPDQDEPSADEGAAERVQRLVALLASAGTSSIDIVKAMMHQELDDLFEVVDSDPLDALARVEHLGQGLALLRDDLFDRIDADDPRIVMIDGTPGVISGVKDGRIHALSPDELPPDALAELDHKPKEARNVPGYL